MSAMAQNPRMPDDIERHRALKNWFHASQWPLAICLALVLAITAVYWRVAQHEFLFYDDEDYVTANSVVRQGITTSGIQWAFTKISGERSGLKDDTILNEAIRHWRA